jgi:hypothetical protein
MRVIGSTSAAALTGGCPSTATVEDNVVICTMNCESTDTAIGKPEPVVLRTDDRLFTVRLYTGFLGDLH